MERRVARTYDPERLAVARSILQRGLQANPFSGCLAQAWGLMELQRGNDWAAVRLVSNTSQCLPVHNDAALWQRVWAPPFLVCSPRHPTPACCLPAMQCIS